MSSENLNTIEQEHLADTAAAASSAADVLVNAVPSDNQLLVDIDNGFVDVHDLIQQNEHEQQAAAAAAAAAVAQHLVKPIEPSRVVVAEPDSTSPSTDVLAKTVLPPVQEPPKKQVSVETTPKQQQQPVADSASTKKGCPMKQQCCVTWSLCSLSESASDYLNSHQCVKSVLLWNNPKNTGIILLVLLVLVELFARNSLVYLLGALVLTAMTLAGTYRLYVNIMGRVKGVEDRTFKTLATQQLELPHNLLRNAVDCVETHGNGALNRFKSLVLWDNLQNSAVAYLTAYAVWTVGSWFNAFTLLSLVIVELFTLPKIYTVYKHQIDSCLMVVHDKSVELCEKVKDKLPMLFKRKSN